MMSTIVEEKLISFKELEQKVFKYVCELGYLAYEKPEDALVSKRSQ